MGKRRPSVIMLFGNKEVGKTTSANEILMWLRKHGYFGNHKIAFADPIKDVAIAFGIPAGLVHGSPLDKSLPTQWRWKDIINAPDYGDSLMTVRQFLQFVGTEVFRKHFHPKTWDNLFWAKVRNGLLVEPNSIFVCHDGRHHSEMDVPSALQDKTIKILIKRETGDQDSHSSEKQLHEMPDELFDHVIINDGTKEELYAKLGGVMESLYL